MLDQSLPTADTANQQLLRQFQQQQLQEQLQKQHLASSRSFYWIASLSIVNSLLILSESDQTFSIGLGVTQMIDYISSMMRAEIPGSAPAIAIVTLSLDAIMASVMVGFGWLAVRGQRWALILGMMLYTLDGSIFLWAGDWFAVLFHAVVLWIIYRGLSALTRLQAPDVRSGAPGHP